ncbi:energy transducer TonB [Sphingobium lactosutens]|uniref:Protein TonB n=1 Tax=Sphingobium lactosutens DS20 TaxID=1331060 RepID=T0IS18_9SPHN|nr:TonB family protein [Sphingobium lactosutens]EQB14635.1 hypothetical protein RLDS_12930 [Sphingobium lactosutens DS20]
MRLMMTAKSAQTMMEQSNGASLRYGAERKSPLALGGTVAVHALVVAAFLLIPREVIDRFNPAPPIDTYAVPPDPPPPPVDQVDPAPDAALPNRPLPKQPTAPDTIIPLPPADSGLIGNAGPGDARIPLPPVLPPPPALPEPVLTQATIDPRALPTFQPDYPGAMIRQQKEGTVTVRITINAQGRVTDIERIEASDDSFWLATQRHALRAWRFRPATRDGAPVASTKILTVRFTLTDR